MSEVEQPKNAGREAMKAIFFGIVSVILFCFAAGAALLALSAHQSRPKTTFDDGDISDMISSIRSEYEKKGFSVQDVVLVRENQQKLVGYMTGSKEKRPARVSCVVNRDVENGKTFWTCR